MPGLYSFLQDIGAGLLYWVPTLCLILGCATILGGLVMLHEIGQRNDTSVVSLGKIVGVMSIGALLFAPAATVNMVGQTAGSNRLAHIGGEERMRAEVPSADELQGKTLAEIVQAFLTPMDPFFDGYGMLFIIIAAMRLKARIKGVPGPTLGGCLIMFLGAIAVIHFDEIAPWAVTQLRLQ